MAGILADLVYGQPVDPPQGYGGILGQLTQQPELRAYQPTMRDSLARMLMGDSRPSPERRSFVEGLLGSSGTGNTGMGLVDFTPAGIPFQVDEGIRSGDLQAAALAVAPFGAGKLPRVAYHGSPKSFDSFDPNIGPYYFAPDPRTASGYATGGQFPPADAAPNVRKSFLHMNNPYEAEVGSSAVPNARNPEWLRANGYDSAILKSKDPRQVEYIALDPNQIAQFYR